MYSICIYIDSFSWRNVRRGTFPHLLQYMEIKVLILENVITLILANPVGRPNVSSVSLQVRSQWRQWYQWTEMMSMQSKCSVATRVGHFLSQTDWTAGYCYCLWNSTCLTLTYHLMQIDIRIPNDLVNHDSSVWYIFFFNSYLHWLSSDSFCFYAEISIISGVLLL